MNDTVTRLMVLADALAEASRWATDHSTWEKRQALQEELTKLFEPVVEPVAHATVRPLQPDECERKVVVKWVNQPVAGPLFASPPPPAEVPLLTELREMLERRAHDSYSCGLLARAALQLLDSQTRSIPLLTDEEIKSIHTQLCNTVGSYYLSVARAIEQLVRQKAGIK